MPDPVEPLLAGRPSPSPRASPVIPRPYPLHRIGPEASTGITARTEARRLHALAALDRDQQAQLGQFFTPEKAAALIASLPRLAMNGTFRVLDPGAGAGSLTAALVERVISEAPGLALHLVAVEVDEKVIPFLSDTLADCEATGRAAGVAVTSEILAGDFLEMATALGGPFVGAELFDLVIMNPPYGKLPAGGAHRRFLTMRGLDAPNLYAAFLALGLLELSEGGQLVAITPRSFANGPYFERFRKRLLASLSLDRIHTFESRSTVFADTGVLQENIVFSGTVNGPRSSVILSTSVGHTDESTSREVDYETVIRPSDKHCFLRLRIDEDDDATAGIMEALPGRLPELGVEVSTGRVVDFRSRDNLRAELEAGAVPLIYPGNVRSGSVEWPRANHKPQAFAVLSEVDKRLLFPPGRYVVVKRFSAKEERRRVVAGLWADYQQEVAFENHVNVFHDGGEGLDEAMARGLCLWLNSEIVDRYFRTFSGHTQVNATDLRSMPYPPREVLIEIGEAARERQLGQQDIDEMINELVIGREAERVD